MGCAIACSKNLTGFRCRLPPVGALCVSTCVSKMPLAAALRVMLFRFCVCISSWSLSVRSAPFFCVLLCCCVLHHLDEVRCRSKWLCLEVVGPGPACHPHTRGKFTFHSRCGRVRVGHVVISMRVVIRGPLCALICPPCVHSARWVRLCSRTHDAPY